MSEADPVNSRPENYAKEIGRDHEQWSPDNPNMSDSALASEGWSTLAEFLIDRSSIIGKPLTGFFREDIDGIDEETLASQVHLANSWEEIMVNTLLDNGMQDRVESFRENMRLYRQAVKEMAESWRRSGRL